MTPRNPMASLRLALPLAGTLAAVLSALALGLSAMLRDLPPWMPFNATSHVLHGPAAAAVTDANLGHTALGAIIHVGSAFFWAAVAILLLRATGGARAGAAWAAGLGTALLAGVIDYGVIPARLSPGWELVLPPWGVVAGLAALGIGIALGLDMVRRRHPPKPIRPVRPVQEPAAEHDPPTALDRLRRPAPAELDQRQQRIDPAGELTEDPNWRGDDNSKQPGGSRPRWQDGDG